MKKEYPNWSSSSDKLQQYLPGGWFAPTNLTSMSLLIHTFCLTHFLRYLKNNYRFKIYAHIFIIQLIY